MVSRLHSKRRDYQRNGVREYFVVSIRQQKVFWFVNRDGLFTEKTSDTDGCYRSEVFPGLWLDPAALLRLDGQGLLDVLRRGLVTDEYAGFVQRFSR